MKIVQVDDTNLNAAAQVHSLSWKESHRLFCSADFIEKHNVKRQAMYLSSEMQKGKSIFMLIDEKPVGIVSVKDNLIENLYVLPNEQGKGYGSELLRFALCRCSGIPCLWVLDNNSVAIEFYLRRGFVFTGSRHQLSDNLAELEMRL